MQLEQHNSLLLKPSCLLQSESTETRTSRLAHLESTDQSTTTPRTLPYPGQLYPRRHRNRHPISNNTSKYTTSDDVDLYSFLPVPMPPQSESITVTKSDSGLITSRLSQPGSTNQATTQSRTLPRLGQLYPYEHRNRYPNDNIYLFPRLPPILTNTSKHITTDDSKDYSFLLPPQSESIETTTNDPISRISRLSRPKSTEQATTSATTQSRNRRLQPMGISTTTYN